MNTTTEVPDDIPTEEEQKKYGKHYNPPEYFFVVMVESIGVKNRQESGLLTFKNWVELEMNMKLSISRS